MDDGHADWYELVQHHVPGHVAVLQGGDGTPDGQQKPDAGDEPVKTRGDARKKTHRPLLLSSSFSFSSAAAHSSSSSSSAGTS